MARPDTDLGQHLLTDDRAIARIVAAAALRPGEHVIDTGAGSGALTRPLAAAVGPTGHVHAIELDGRMLKALHRDRPPHVQVVEGDLLQVPFPPDLDAVVGNPPFRIAAPLVERVTATGISRAVLVLPRELVDRLVAPPGSERYGKLTVRIALLATVEDLGTLSRHAFTPPPAVACGFVRIRPRPDVAPVDTVILDEVLEAARAGWTRTAKGTFDGLARRFRADSAALTQLLRGSGWADQHTRQLPPEAFAAVARFLQDARGPP